MNLLLVVALLPCLFWDKGPETQKALAEAGIHEIAVPPSLSGAWKSVTGIKATTVDSQKLQKVLTPEVKFRRNVASATRTPWVDSNGWRFIRDSSSSYLYEAPGKSAALAAAESFAYGVQGYIHTDEAGLKPLAEMLGFLCKLDQAKAAPLTNIVFVDDKSPQSGELMNLLVRRNLLFRIGDRASGSNEILIDPKSPEFPKSEVGNPSFFAERVRSKLTDEKRFLRVYGSELVIGRLLGNSKETKLYLLNYGAEKLPVEGLRVRILGSYKNPQVKAFGEPDSAPLDVSQNKTATEFTLRRLPVFAAITLLRSR